MGSRDSGGAFWGLGTLALIVWLGGASPAAEAESSTALVQKALGYEVRGDNAQRQALLQEALQQTPNEPAAHWHRGEVFWEGAWRTPQEVAQLAKQDARLQQYRTMREETAATADGQADLARWCRKNHLDEEQRIHWIGVLKDRPNDAEALKALRRLGLRPFQGRLRSEVEIADLKEEMQASQTATETWRARIGEWHRLAAGPNGAMPAELRQSIVQLVRPVDMQALNQAVWLSVGKNHRGQPYHSMVLALVDALGENRSPAAAEALVQYAVLSDFEDVREAAIADLKQRPWDHHVPPLLALLQGEMESGLGFDVTAEGLLITHQQRFQAGGLSNASGTTMTAPRASSAPLILNPTPETNANRAWMHQAALGESQMRAAREAAAQRESLERMNRGITARNTRVVAVLRELTGQNLEVSSTAWWNWWQNYNEQGRPHGPQENSSPEDGRQERWIATHADSARQQQMWRDQASLAAASGFTPSNQSALGWPSECFAPGTLVWTVTGRVPIETIQMGDRVLAQDPESGELAYKPVLAVTVREEGPRTQLEIDGETLLSTGGHPYWVSGQGWRRAKDLQPNDRLHAVSGAVAVSSVGDLTVAEAGYTKAHNLILREFHTFFVGAQGLLVHDNTTRAATANLVPGLPPLEANEETSLGTP